MTKINLSTKSIFLDGLIIPADPALLRSLTPGVLTGRGVFETMRAYQGKIFALSDHLKRMKEGLSKIKLTLPANERRIKNYLHSSLEKNNLKSARVRLTVWRAKERTRLSIMVLPYQSYPAAQYFRGFHATISTIRRDEKKSESRIKSINYLPFILALKKARAKGQDEAILLNTKGQLVEGSRSNIFFIRKGILLTPSLICGCLNGITRQKVLKLAKDLGLKSKEVRAYPEDLWDAEEAFLTNSLMEIMPLTSIQGKGIGALHAGPISLMLMKAYRKLVAKSLGIARIS